VLFSSLYSSGQHRYLHSFPTRRSSDLLSTGLRHHAIQPISSASITRFKPFASSVSCSPVHVSSEILIPKSYISRATINPNTMTRSEEHTSELQSRENLVFRLLLEKKNC